VKTQNQMFNEERVRLAERDSIMLELLFGKVQITDDELCQMIRNDPNRYSRYEGYLGWKNRDENGDRMK
jgi:hypothetical protein